jgi:hypothetical protein
MGPVNYDDKEAYDALDDLSWPISKDKCKEADICPPLCLPGK